MNAVIPMRLLCIAVLFTVGTAAFAQSDAQNQATADIRIRDPFVLAEDGYYYLYGTITASGEKGFDGYRSTDLETWEGPFPVMRPPAEFWANRDFWAPEVHKYQGKFYLFATFAREYPIRGTQVCVSDSPLGPFVPLGAGPQTPRDWQCLDGTLFVDGEAQPWMVFCHEWTQVGDGEIAAIRLSGDLSESVGEPKVLFRASAVPWGGVSHHDQFEGRVTDGPFLHRTKEGTLLMIWSTFNKKRDYCVAVARSTSGTLDGPWVQGKEPFLASDAGHGMLFRRHDGALMLSLHGPNKKPHERAKFIEVYEEDLVALTR